LPFLILPVTDVLLKRLFESLKKSKNRRGPEAKEPLKTAAPISANGWTKRRMVSEHSTILRMTTGSATKENGGKAMSMAEEESCGKMETSTKENGRTGNAKEKAFTDGLTVPYTSVNGKMAGGVASDC
jgi:hypothetical protein